MERIEEYAKRVEQLYNLKKQDIKVKNEEAAEEIINLVLQMFEAATKEENMLFDEITLKSSNSFLDFSCIIYGKEYTKANISYYSSHLSEVSDKICNTKSDPKILNRARELYLEMAKKIPSYYISEAEVEEDEARSVTFCIGQLQ